MPPGTALANGAVALASISTFGTFGGSAGVTNQGLNTVINGDIGTTAVSTAVTGFHDAGPGLHLHRDAAEHRHRQRPDLHRGAAATSACPSEGTATTFAIATQARADALAAYNALVAKPGGPDPGAGNLANLTLAPGMYTAAAGSFMIQGGNLTLDAQGNANAVWVFQMATTLTVGGPGAAFPSSVILANGAQAKNVFWQVGSAATINAAGGGTMVGTIIAQAGAAISTPGNVDHRHDQRPRALARRLGHDGQHRHQRAGALKPATNQPETHHETHQRHPARSAWPRSRHSRRLAGHGPGPTGWYGGASIGRTAATIDDDRITRRPGRPGPGDQLDRRPRRGHRLQGVRRLPVQPNFGVEAGFFDLGHFGYTATTVPAGTLSGDIRVKGLNLDLVGTLPLTGKLLRARAGSASRRCAPATASAPPARLACPMPMPTPASAAPTPRSAWA